MFDVGRRVRMRAAVAAGVAWVAACHDLPSDHLTDAGAAAAAADTAVPDAPATTQQRLGACRPALASDALPARGAVMTRASASGTELVSTSDLYETFRSHCQGCHIDQSLGDFRVNRQNFGDVVGENALALVRSNDPATLMPPPPVGRPFDTRGDDDPLVEFAGMLEAWIVQGRPDDAFYAQRSSLSATRANRYVLPRDVALGLTNLGNCIPSATGFASEKGRSAELDVMFAQASELPERLEQTDLFTLDARELARHGVVAFAPAYTLWSDDAKKIRMVRVPRGEQIRFDAEAQRFVIPPNTRFYKTFLKRVVDRDGNERYRKMETRLIVARPDDESDEAQAAGQRQRALFGTYAWNEQETEAVLVRDPLRDGRPFRDRLVTYYLDERKVDALIAAGKTDLAAQAQSDRALSRTYAIPGSERCVHCHMGSPSQSFVLGFTPLQLRRRRAGQGGVIEPTGPDELNQLERLIEYGVIGALASPDDVVPLEATQGARKPRNDYELAAQGYMLGNCAHCHNPRGFPSSVSPELVEALNFLPDTERGGIFEFSLERYSPRIFRGADQNVRIPYITPSLYDLPVAYSAASAYVGTTKTLVCTEREEADPVVRPDLAPWRSLIYRNVDTPFSYADDNTIFPHMPRDVPGYDCRARRILGSWMVSIPARLKDARKPVPGAASQEKPVLDPSVYPESGDPPGSEGPVEQPYEEIRPGDPDYEPIVDLTAFRVSVYRDTVRYRHCPDPDLDIIDPAVVKETRLFPVAESNVTVEQCLVRGNVVPERPHWFVTDTSEPASAWTPRRADWQRVLQYGEIDETPPTVELVARNDNDRRTVRLLTGSDPWGRRSERTEGVHVTPALRAFALTELPLGLWSVKEECSFDGVERIGDFSGDARALWMDLSHAAADAPVYSIAPGAQVFTSICSNCHGPLADSRGRMADTISDLTGGATRVANLRDGIFGPASEPGQHRAQAFSAAAMQSGLSADDWAARYLLWMGLGGTQRFLPSPVLTVVANTRVLGTRREGLDGLAALGANMLAVAELLCQGVLPFEEFKQYSIDLRNGSLVVPPSVKVPLFRRSVNGDAELWERLCTLDNPAPVRALELDGLPQHNIAITDYDRNPLVASQVGIPAPKRPLLFRRDSFPARDFAVGDHRGRVQGRLDAANLAPWCILPPVADPSLDQAGQALFVAREMQQIEARFRSDRGDPSAEPPYCPEEYALVEQALAELPVHEVPSRSSMRGAFQRYQQLRFDYVDAQDWARRGAMNAGLAVFVYLDALARGEVQRPVDYDHCEELR